jgi:hypothetical protein
VHHYLDSSRTSTATVDSALGRFGDAVVGLSTNKEKKKKKRHAKEDGDAFEGR